MTNFERIKAMSVEEMAGWLCKMLEDCSGEECSDCEFYNVYCSCVYPEDMKLYLESEMQENDT
jgi:hypothetical protein